MLTQAEIKEALVILAKTLPTHSEAVRLAALAAKFKAAQQ